MAPETEACISPLTLGKNFEHDLDLGYQLRLSAADRASGVFPHRTSIRVIDGIAISVIRGPEMGVGEVVEILQRPLLTLSGGMVRC